MQLRHLPLVALLFALSFFSEAGHAESSLGTTIRLRSGVVRTGPRDTNGVLSFKGIPYAAPPVGALRWRSPQSEPTWMQPRDASEFGPSCLANGIVPGPRDSEDCLTINVWTPAQSQRARLPVFVWIPGGGFQSSASSRLNIDGARLASKGLIVVSFNYRVGVYGFLAHPGLDREDSPSGNFGLEDQIAALRWIQRNVERFGGNAHKVTIAGESTGGISVALLMTSPKARGLFAKAIGESHGFWDTVHGSIPTHEEALIKGQALAQRLAGGDIEALRALPAETISRETTIAGGTADFLTAGFSPSVDHVLLPDAPAAAFANGTQAHVPLLAGFNASEGATFKRFANRFASPDDYRKALRNWIGDENFEEAQRLYPAQSDSQIDTSVEQLFGDLSSKEQTWEWIQLHRKTSGSPVYAYIFDMHSTYTPVPAHTAEIDYVFGTLQPHWLSPTGGAPGEADKKLAAQMMDYWANFSRTGDPNGPGLPHWPVYELQSPHVLLLGTSPAAIPEDSERFRFLQRFRINGRMPDAWRSAPLAP